jgi:hypothetical protein
MKGIGSAALVAGALLVAIVLAEIPPFPALAAWIDAHQPRLLIGLGIVLLLAFVLFFGGIVKQLMDHGETLTHSEVEDVDRSVHMAARPVAWRASKYRIIGAASGRGGTETFALRELKAAWRNGEVWRDPEWRRRLATVAGALLLVVGICGLGVVVGPPWLKVLLGGALAYAFGKLAIGWRRN